MESRPHPDQHLNSPALIRPSPIVTFGFFSPQSQACSPMPAACLLLLGLAFTPITKCLRHCELQLGGKSPEGILCRLEIFFVKLKVCVWVGVFVQKK